MPGNSSTSEEPFRCFRGSQAVRDSILDICLALISGATRCRCVGVRVEEDGDFPLVRWVGFSERFVEREMSLLPEGASPHLTPEEKLACLECLCGRVIRDERTGCEKLFSGKGCLWLNDFSDADRVSQKLKSEMRTACLEEHFQSFALVPCSADHGTLALLHVCDREKGLLSDRLVRGLAESGTHFAKLLFHLRGLQRIESRPPEVKEMSLRILVVDDDVEMADLVGNMLEAKGHEVSTAFSGLGAIEIMSDQQFDLVITDLNMPLMSGVGLAREIKKRWHPYAPPVILMSGTYTEDVAAREDWRTEVAAFLSKPFTAESVMAAIEAVLP